MEKALMCCRVKNLECINNDEVFDYLYFGNEFCENMIPDMKEIKYAIDFCKSNKLGFVLVTPYTSENGLSKISSIVQRLMSDGDKFDIVFNDWGVFNLCKEINKEEIIMGRLLNKMKRDFRIKNDADKLPKDLLKYLKTSPVFSRSFLPFLKEQGIRRVEFDNILQGYEMESGFDPDAGIKLSLYYPYIYFTTSRTCENNYFYYSREKSKKDYTCKRECKRRELTFVNEDKSNLLYVAGKTVFLKNENIDGRILPFVDRLIVQKDIPH